MKEIQYLPDIYFTFYFGLLSTKMFIYSGYIFSRGLSRRKFETSDILTDSKKETLHQVLSNPHKNCQEKRKVCIYYIYVFSLVFFWWINLHPEGVSWSSLISSFIGDRHWEDWCYQESVSVIVSSLTNDSSVFCVSLNYLSDGLITSITLCLCPFAFQASTHLIFSFLEAQCL